MREEWRSPAPIVQTTRVALIPVTPADYEFVYHLMVDPEAGGRLDRYSGGVPSREQVVARMWDGVLAQFVVAGRATGRRHGLTVLASPDFRNPFAYFSLVGVPTPAARALTFEAGVHTIDYAFANWDFRKIYFETSAVA